MVILLQILLWRYDIMALLPMNGHTTTYDEFTESVASKLGKSPASTKEILSDITDVVKESLMNKDQVMYRDLATFRLDVEGVRHVRVIETGDIETIPAKFYPHATFSDKIKEAVSELKVTPADLDLVKKVREVDAKDHRNED